MRRRNYVVQRFLALAALIAALTAMLVATVALGSWAVDLDIGFGRLVAASLSVALLAAFFGSLALAAGAIRPGRAQAIAISAGAAVVAWLLDGLGPAVDYLHHPPIGAPDPHTPMVAEPRSKGTAMAMANGGAGVASGSKPAAQAPAEMTRSAGPEAGRRVFATGDPQIQKGLTEFEEAARIAALPKKKREMAVKAGL